jgi:hypothetical protein
MKAVKPRRTACEPAGDKGWAALGSTRRSRCSIVRVVRHLYCVLSVLAWLFCASSVAAEPGGPSAFAEAGGGQPGLAARVAGQDVLYAVCPGGAGKAGCTAAPGDPALHLPAGIDAASVTLTILSVGAGRHAVRVHATNFDALLAAVPGKKEARVLWSGVTGFSQGEPGEEHGDFVDVTDPEEDGTVRVLVGEIREDVSICGRRSIVSPKVLDPRDLGWKGAIVQRLSKEERAKATELVAARAAAESAGPALSPLLQATAASSAIGSPGALTDGDPETFWAEKRGGDGRGEFVHMNAPEQAAITSLSFVLRPAGKDLPKGAAPRKVWLATNDALFGVTFPEDAWSLPGARYDVAFTVPLKTRCLSLVLDEAWTRGRTDVDVTVAELIAHTEFDGVADVKALAGALAGGKERARMAASILTRMGDAAYDAVIEAYPKLDDAGRVLALEVIDGAPCEKSAPLYVKATAMGRAGEVHHARDRLLRCGRAAAASLGAALSLGSDEARIAAADQLALVAPDVAVRRILELLPGAKRLLRSQLRTALAKAAESDAARAVVLGKLSDATLPKETELEVLRAFTPRPELASAASAAFARLAAGADFRTRYLLLGPAARLSASGDAGAQAFLHAALMSDADPHLRARAAEAFGELTRPPPELVRAISDADARVRDAALASLARIGQGSESSVGLPPGSVGVIAERLASDPWTFVRGHAADALAKAPPGEAADRPLGWGLADESPKVRVRVIDALGRRGARAYADGIAARLDDAKEDGDVRSHAARALGRLCERRFVDRLTELARGAASPTADGPTQALGADAAAALAQLDPPDLATRLAPLLSREAPPAAREVGSLALATRERCPR